MDIIRLIIAIFVFLFLGVLFPLWASKKAEEKGLTTISKIARISIFVFMGHIGGLIAWIAAMANHRGVVSQAKPRQKTWLDNLMENGLLFLGGTIVTFLGYLMWKSIQSGTRGAMIIGFIPIPIQILPILALISGFLVCMVGLIKSIISLYNRFIRGDQRYITK